MSLKKLLVGSHARLNFLRYFTMLTKIMQTDYQP